jgi:hypothetical protein
MSYNGPAYRDRATGGLTTLDAAKRKHENISFGSTLTSTDFDILAIDLVHESPKPETTILQVIKENDPVQKGDKWYRSFSVVNATDGMTSDQIQIFKQTIADRQKTQINLMRDAILSRGYKVDFSNYGIESGGLASGFYTIQTRDPIDLMMLQHLDTSSKNLLAASSTANAVNLRVEENAHILVPAQNYIAIYHNLITYRINVTQLASKLKDRIDTYVTDATKTPNDIFSTILPDNPTF